MLHVPTLAMVAVFVTTLHPDVMGRRFLWTAASGVTTSEALFDVVETDEYRRSPFAIVYDTRKPVRYRFATDGCPDIPVLQELRADGATDYVAFPLRSFTFAWYRQMAENTPLIEALQASLKVAGCVAVVSTVHNEEALIVPFLEHYFSQGVQKVILLANDCRVKQKLHRSVQ